MQQPARWVDKLAEWLPYHEDQHYLKLQAAVHGQYRPQYEPPREDTPTPSGIAARLGRIHSRVISAMHRHQQPYR